MIRIRTILSIALCAAALGCTEYPRDTEVLQLNREATEATGLTDPSDVVIGPSRAMINTIITLRADTDVLDKGSITWFVNGIELPDATGMRMVPEGFRKGDIIHAVITKGSMKFVSNELSLQNSPPVIRRASIQPATPGVSDRLTVTSYADDIDADAISYDYHWSVNGTFAGEEEYLMDSFKRGDRITAVITPRDGDDRGKSVTVNTSIINSYPRVAESMPRFDGKHFKQSIDATDADNDILTYTLVEGPDGMTIDAATGILSWSPEADDAGIHELKIMIDDSNGGKILLPITTAISFTTALN